MILPSLSVCGVCTCGVCSLCVAQLLAMSCCCGSTHSPVLCDAETLRLCVFVSDVDSCYLPFFPLFCTDTAVTAPHTSSLSLLSVLNPFFLLSCNEHT